MPMSFGRQTLRRLALLSAALLLVGARPDGHRGPVNIVTVTADGAHLLGDPAAKIKLTEYISYTCPHCAHFNQESEAVLRMNFVASGKGSVEVRPYIRNPIDMAAALLVDCGGAAHFIRLHDTMLNTQTEWLAKAAALNDTQRQRWENGPIAGRMRAIASDLGLYAIMENNGFSQPQIDHCLNDDAAMKRLAAQTEAAVNAGIEGTPGFAIDGVVLAGTYDWAMLAPQLQARE
ncbi:MAG: DsbA family protein [Pseudomonadota bacterium]|nr:DsbA family protein [Pseudomonadota bacterium]